MRHSVRRDAGDVTLSSGCIVKRDDSTLAVRQDCPVEEITRRGISLESGCIVKRIVDGALIHLRRDDCPVEQQNRRRTPDFDARHLVEAEGNSEPDLEVMCLIRRDDGSLGLRSPIEQEEPCEETRRLMARHLTEADTDSEPDLEAMCLIRRNDGSLGLRLRVESQPEEPCEKVSRPLTV